jgi:hypothetical protein
MTIKHFIHDAETGETVEIELTAEEIAARELAESKRVADKVKEEQDKIQAREDLLARLGITAEEAALLLS